MSAEDGALELVTLIGGLGNPPTAELVGVEALDALGLKMLKMSPSALLKAKIKLIITWLLESTY